MGGRRLTAGYIISILSIDNDCIPQQNWPIDLWRADGIFSAWNELSYFMWFEVTSDIQGLISS